MDSKSENPPAYEKAALEFRYEAGEPIGLSDLADSFKAVDRLFIDGTSGTQNLTVVEIRSGSIFAVLQPSTAMLGHAFDVMNAVNTLTDFSKKVKLGFDVLTGRVANPTTEMPPDPVAKELAEIIKPLAGKKQSKFGFVSFRYRSETKDRIVDVEATYGTDDLNAAYLRAGSLETFSATSFTSEHTDKGKLLRSVRLSLFQANAGAAKAKGVTGDRGVVTEVSDKQLPVYFASSVNDLKERMVGGQRNPLRGSYIVDVMVNYEAGEPKSYTVIELHKIAKVAKVADPPLLTVKRRRPRTT